MAVRARLQKEMDKRETQKSPPEPEAEETKKAEGPVTDLDKHIFAAQNVIQSKLLAVDKALTITAHDAVRKGVHRNQIKDIVKQDAIKLEKKVKQTPEGLEDKRAGTTKERAIKVTAFMQEILLLKEANATPVRWFMHKDKETNKYYDEVLCLRLTSDWKTHVQTIIFFDVTACHQEIKKITGRDTTNKPFYGLMACGSCAKKNDDGKMRNCTRCKSVAYCGKECQIEHYTRKEGGHRKDCLGIASEYKLAQLAEGKRLQYVKKKEEESKVSQEKGYRYLAFQLRDDLVRILEEYTRAVVFDVDINEKVKQMDNPTQFHLNHTMENKELKYTEELSKLTSPEFRLVGLGWRPANKDEPKECDVLCALLEDATDSMHTFIDKNGGNGNAYNNEEPIKVDFLYVKKGEGEKYVNLCKTANDIIGIHDDLPIEKRSEYLFNTISTNDELAVMLDNAKKEDVTLESVSDNRLLLMEQLKQASLTGEWIYVDTIRVAQGGATDFQTVKLQPRSKPEDRFLARQPLYVADDKSWEKVESKSELKLEDMRKGTVVSHTSFD
jgi:hypothetical protein